MSAVMMTETSAGLTKERKTARLFDFNNSRNALFVRIW